MKDFERLLDDLMLRCLNLEGLVRRLGPSHRESMEERARFLTATCEEFVRSAERIGEDAGDRARSLVRRFHHHADAGVPWSVAILDEAAYQGGSCHARIATHMLYAVRRVRLALGDEATLRIIRGEFPEKRIDDA